MNRKSALLQGTTRTAVLSIALLLPASLPAVASDEHGPASGHSGSNSSHVLGFFVGATKDAHDETDTTYGIEYEYKFNYQFGVGAVYETSPDAHHEDGVSVYLASGYWHPYAGWRLGLGAGQEKVHGSHGYTENLVRSSVTYDFHVAGFGIAPSVSLDRVDGESIVVYGMSFSRGF